MKMSSSVKRHSAKQPYSHRSFVRQDHGAERFTEKFKVKSESAGKDIDEVFSTWSRASSVFRESCSGPNFTKYIDYVNQLAQPSKRFKVTQ